MVDASSLHGIIPPICSPLAADGSLDVASLRNLIDFQIDGGVHGIFALGSTGECVLLTDEQKQQLVRETVASVDGRVPVFVGLLEPSTQRCIGQARTAAEMGADALVLAAPSYYRVGQQEILDRFRMVRAAVDLPILAYDVPSAVGVKIERSTILALIREGLIVGMKDSSGAVDNFRQLLVDTRAMDFRAFTGSELLVDVCLQMGAAGSVPGLANVFPAEYVRIYDLGNAQKWQEAAQIQERLMTCFWELIGQGDPGYGISSSALGGFKAALKQLGVIASSRAADPLHSFEPEEEERVADVMRRHGFL